MSKAFGKIVLGAAIIGAAFLTGGATILGAVAVNSAGLAAATTLGATLATTALGSMMLAVGAATVLSGVGQALAKTPKVLPSQLDRLNASIIPNTPRKAIFGRTAMATDIRYVEPSGENQEYIDYIIAVASHRVTSIEQIWLEDTLAWSVGVIQPKYSGYLWIDTVLEGSAGNAIAINGGVRWGSTCRLTGCAYVHLRIKRTGNSKKAESPFSAGLASRMTIIGKGMPVYDPRRDSTVPGGSGSHRANDQSTWEYTSGGVDIGANLALQTLAYALGWRINGKIAVGRGLPASRIDLASFGTAANICDETVASSVLGSEPRFHGGTIISEGDDPGTVWAQLMASCNGRLRDGAGRLSMVVMHNDLAAAATDDGLNDDDVLSAFTWNPDPSLDQTFNVVRGRYTDPSTNALYQMIDYPEVRIDSVDGIDRILTLDLPAIQSASTAQRIAKQTLQRKQYQRSFSATFSALAWKYQVGDVVPFTFAALAFERRLFRVEQQTIAMDGTCPMVLVEENAAIYAWDASDRAPVVASDPIRYDPLNNPLIQGIAEASGDNGLSMTGEGWLYSDGALFQDFHDDTRLAGRYAAELAYADHSTVRWCAPTDFPVTPGETLYYQHVVVSNGGPAGETCNASISWYDADGVAMGATNLSSQTVVTLPQVFGQWTVVRATIVVPAGAAFGQPYAERPTFTTNSFYVGEPYLGRAKAIQSGSIIAADMAPNQAVDYAAVVPGQINWRTASGATTVYSTSPEATGSPVTLSSGKIGLTASGYAGGARVTIKATIGGSGTGGPQTGTATITPYYRINGGAWVALTAAAAQFGASGSGATATATITIPSDGTIQFAYQIDLVCTQGFMTATSHSIDAEVVNWK